MIDLFAGFQFYRHLLLAYCTVRTLARVGLTTLTVTNYFLLVGLYFLTLKMFPHLPLALYVMCPYLAAFDSIVIGTTLVNAGRAFILCHKEMQTLKHFLTRRNSYMSRRLRSVPVWCFEIGLPDLRMGTVQRFFAVRYFFEVFTTTATLSLITHFSH